MPQNNARLKVQLFISCRDLANVDYVGKTDSLVALYTKSSHNYSDGKKTGKWVKTDQTEVIQNNLNPDFMKSLFIHYYFERH